MNRDRVATTVSGIARPAFSGLARARSLAAHLKRGGLIAYPTESCYGLGCDPDNHVAVQRLLKLKHRPQRKGLILIASGYQQIARYLQALTPDQQRQLGAAGARAGDYLPDARQAQLSALVAQRT